MTILEQCAISFQKARGAIYESIRLLYRVREENAWQGHFGSFSEYVEEECKIDRSQASRLLTTYEHFVLKGGVEHAQLTGIDPEKLYLAIKLDKPVGGQLAAAQTLTRGELKIEVADRKTPHECEEMTICKLCNRRMK